MRTRSAALVGGTAAVMAVALGAGAASAHTVFDLVSDGAYTNAKDTHSHEAQHGHEEGHLEPRQSDDLEVVSTLAMSRVTEGGIADVAVHGDFAYLNSWGGAGNCGRNGTHVVDISDVANPVEVAFINSKEGSYPGEGAQVLSMSTPFFTGDVLLTNNELCKVGVGFGGINLYDVTDPYAPANLSLGFGDYTTNGIAGKNRKKTANQVHSVFGWTAGAKAYAVMVDNEEFTDVDIVDITNPRKPALIAEYDLVEEGIATEAGLDEVFLHDMVVKEIDGRQIMLASYWDGGYVRLDVTDPRDVEVLADSQFGAVDSQPVYPTLADALAGTDPTAVAPEGNAHQAEFTLDDEFVIAADEDFSPFALDATNVTDGTEITASPGSDTRQLEGEETVTGQAVFAGRACTPAETAAAPSTGGPYVAVVERGLCDFTVKVANVIQAGGYDAVLIFNRTALDGCNTTLGMSVEGDIPTFGVAPRQQGYAIFGLEAQYDDAACRAGDGTQLSPMVLGQLGDTLTFSQYFDGWGFVRLLDADTMTEIDSYAIPEARTAELADGFGDLSVHEVAVSQQDASLAYLSYYAGGLRVVEVGPGGISEVGQFIDEGGNNFWGVEVFEQDGTEYVALSDRDLGLYILRYTP
ncbi:PA domain-containing protein [Aquipuribacter nitratireducens]|uniref:PA domain-containing protein n=1 Tax=Aquipuribacter nitratireducens TaxID=650104 RepID=A0ABW0GQM5_9MICO